MFYNSFVFYTSVFAHGFVLSLDFDLFVGASYFDLEFIKVVSVICDVYVDSDNCKCRHGSTWQVKGYKCFSLIFFFLFNFFFFFFFFFVVFFFFFWFLCPFLVYLITNMNFYQQSWKSLIWLSHQCNELQKTYLCTSLCIFKFAKNINLFKRLNNDHGSMLSQ